MSDLSGKQYYTNIINEVTLLVITSPSPSNPSIDMISKVIDSFNYNIDGLSDCNVIIISDGYKIADSNRMKKGYHLKNNY